MVARVLANDADETSSTLLYALEKNAHDEGTGGPIFQVGDRCRGTGGSIFQVKDRSSGGSPFYK